MSRWDENRKPTATAATGLGLVATGGALRHQALEAAYEGRGKKRPRIVQERAFVTRQKVPGRAKYLAGAGAGFLGIPAAATGTHQLANNLRRKEPASKADRSFLREGIDGATEAFTSRSDLVKDKPPPKAVIGSYGAGALAGVGGGALTHHLARKLPGSVRAGLAATAGVGAGVATIPAQSKVLSRSKSMGDYTVTPVGVRRIRKKPVRPSRGAVVADSRADARGARRAIVPGEMHKRASEDHLNYPGSRMSPGRKRAAVIAAGGAPLIGDFTSAAAAARMAPPELRKKTAALQFGGSNAGQIAGAAAGGYGAAALARKVPSIGARATQARSKIDRAQHEAVRRVSPKTAQRMAESSYNSKPNRLATTAGKLPGAGKGRRAVSRAARPMFGHGPGVAAAATLGAMAGQGVGGYAGGYAGYGHALSLERKRNARLSKRSESATRGGKQLPKPTKAQIRVEGVQLNRQKRQQALLSTVSGSAGLAALGATVGARGKVSPRLRGRLQAAQTPLLTTSAGVGGYGSLNFAGIQRKEARRAEHLEKALGPATFRIRRPSSRRGYLRQTSTSPRRSTYVRGGVS